MAAAFDFNSAYSAGFTGSGITIGIIGTGPAMNIDFTTYKAQYGLGGASTLVFPPVLSSIAAANAYGQPLGTPPAVTAPCPPNTPGDDPGYPPSESPTATCNPEDGEAQIDTEQAALARDATIDFYLAYVPSECSPIISCAGYDYQGLAEADDEIQQIIADNKVDIVSGSYGGPEILNLPGYVSNNNAVGYDPSSLGSSEMAAMAVEGIAAFFSSGDQGAQTCAPYALAYSIPGSLQCASYPSSDINVTAVGGVTVPLSNAGALTGPITGWGQQTFAGGYGGASGGGVSCYEPLPPWQMTEPAFASAAGGSLSVPSSGCVLAGSTGGRLLPDISMEADPVTGVATVTNVHFGAQQVVYGGTSVASPQMAAMWALVLQACSKSTSCATATGAAAYRLGNAAPILWSKIYQSQTLYNSTIYDVVFGNNGINACEYQGNCPNPNPTPAPTVGYAAGAGWDAVTGLGVPFARHLITAVTGL
jgi:subtilase family serine protease